MGSRCIAALCLVVSSPGCGSDGTGGAADLEAPADLGAAVDGEGAQDLRAMGDLSPVPDGAPGDSSVAFDGSAGDMACVNLACKQVQCPMGMTTSISGSVYAPNGLHPLPNFNVYVPNAAVAPVTPGPSCDGCTAGLSGSPLVKTRTDSSGKFLLADMPVGANVPVVIQLGKWRRQITVNTVACTNTAVGAGLTRLPRNKAEGDIPKIALVTGNADPLECLLRKIGIDDSEFTNPNGTGRVNLYQSTANGGGTDRYSGGLGGAVFPNATALWGVLATLRNYDLVMLGCEGTNTVSNKPNAANIALQEYVNGGGRVMAEHLHSVWMEQGGKVAPSNQAWSAMVTWAPNQGILANPTQETVLTGFPDGLTMYQWLQTPAISAASVVPPNPIPSRFPVTDARASIMTINDKNDVQTWIQTVANSTPQHFSVDTPVGAMAGAACGQFSFSDLHGGSGDMAAAPNFPGGCITAKANLSPQAMALEYLFFETLGPVCHGSPPP